MPAEKKELLAADTTRNPTIHRFYNHAACQASGKEYPLPEPQEDVLVRETFLPNDQLAAGAKPLLESLPRLLPIKSRVGPLSCSFLTTTLHLHEKYQYSALASKLIHLISQSAFSELYHRDYSDKEGYRSVLRGFGR